MSSMSNAFQGYDGLLPILLPNHGPIPQVTCQPTAWCRYQCVHTNGGLARDPGCRPAGCAGVRQLEGAAADARLRPPRLQSCGDPAAW